MVRQRSPAKGSVVSGSKSRVKLTGTIPFAASSRVRNRIEDTSTYGSTLWDDVMDWD